MSLIDPSFREQTAIKVGSQPMDMAFRSDELFVACQGDGSVHVIDIPGKRHKAQFPGRHRLRVARVFLRGTLDGENDAIGHRQTSQPVQLLPGRPCSRRVLE